MKKSAKTIAATIAAALAVGAGSLAAPKAENAAKAHGPIAWSEKLADAQKTAAKEKKVIFVDFYADWCGPCKAMLETTYKDKAVVTKSKKFVPVLINIDKQPQLAEKYKVESIPTVIFMDAKGKVLARNEGYADAKGFLTLMDEASKKK